MPAIRNATTTNAVSASATGLTGLDNAGTDFSWGAWLRMRPAMMANGQASIWVHADSGGGQSKNGVSVFAIETGEVRFRPQTASNNLVSSPNGLVTTTYNHIGIRKDANAVTFFLNGRAVARVANTITITVSGTRLTELGGPTVGAIQCLRGADVWDVRVFPLLALTNGEMQALADPRSSMRGCKQRLIYQHNWRVAGTGAQTLLDESGNGNSLTTSATTEQASVVDEPDWRGVLFGRRVFGYVAAGGTLYTQSLAASLTPSSTVARQTTRPLAASLTPAATVVRDSRRTLAASLTPAATVTKRTARSLSASLTPSATLAGIKTALKSLAASLTPSATLVRRTSRTLAASITAAGAVLKQTRRALAASMTLTATVLGVLGGAGGFSGFITTTIQWLARYSAALTKRPRHDATLTGQPRYDATITQQPRHSADLTHLTDD